MSDPVLPLLDDPLVRSVARANHVPVEVWTYGAIGGAALNCRQDGQTWPCATRQGIEAQARIEEITKP